MENFKSFPRPVGFQGKKKISIANPLLAVKLIDLFILLFIFCTLCPRNVQYLKEMNIFRMYVCIYLFRVENAFDNRRLWGHLEKIESKDHVKECI